MLLNLGNIAYAMGPAPQGGVGQGGAGGLIGSLIPLILIFVIFYFLFIRPQQKRNSLSILGLPLGPSLVLRKYEINKTPSSNTDEIINIVGRLGGPIDWALTHIGIETEYFLKVTGQEVRIKQSSLFGQQYAVVPLTSVSSVHCGYVKPIQYMILAVLAVLLGLYVWLFKDESFSYFFGSIIIGLFFVILYFLLKRVGLVVRTRGASLPLGLIFKRSVIENIPVDIELAKLTIEIINNLIVESQTKQIDVKDVVNKSEKTLGSETLKPVFCPQCGEPIEQGSKFCTSCGQSI